MADTDTAPRGYEHADAEHYKARKETGFFGRRGAGALLIAKDTGRIMFVLRSAKVDQPFTWGNVGGAIDEAHANERPVDAAEREIYEETGYNGALTLVPLLVFRHNDFTYSNFLGIVEREFKPVLGWEADRAVWVKPGNLPKPLHFGMKSLFGDAASAKTIRHYASMFAKGDTAIGESEEITEEIDVSAAIKQGEDVANEINKRAEAQAKAIKAGVNPADTVEPNGEPKKVQPRPGATTGKKSLNPIGTK
ncbi:MAG: NUDIX hydrolase [Oxalobacteraceae bacterium]|nr:MAG: NUDIX hydrolase [Oxalobacteraceae bacterium]